MELSLFKDEICEVALAIKNMLDLDVVVVDRWLTTITNTFQYSHKPVGVHINSVVGNVIITGQKRVIENRKFSKVCLTCEDFKKCELEGIIGVPIFLGAECIGAIAVLIRVNRVGSLSGNVDKIIAFLNTVADHFSKMVESESSKQRVRTIEISTAQILEDISNLVVFTDDKGNIAYCNERFCQWVGQTQEETLQMPLADLLNKHRVLQSAESFRTGEYFIGVAGEIAELFQMKTIQYNDNTMYLFVIQEAVQLLNFAKPYGAEKKMGTFFGTSKAMQEANAAAVIATKNHLPVLIEGSSGMQNRELMKIISRTTPNTVFSPTIVECAIDDGELRHVLFGDQKGRVGLLWPSRKCAICLSRIECMPYYIQEQLVSFLIDTGAQGAQIRIFATSEVRLESMVNQGRFSKNLYHMIAQNHIIIPDLWDDIQDVQYYFNYFLTYFSQLYGREKKECSDAFWNRLYTGKKMSYPELREFAERYVTTSEPEVVEHLTDAWTLEDDEEPLDDQEMRCRLRKMLGSNMHRSNIAQQLGISRATLYRWIKKYEL